MAKNAKKSKGKPAPAVRSRKAAPAPRKAKAGPTRGAKTAPKRAVSGKRTKPKQGKKLRKSGGKASSATKRRLGLRGAAPWAARHAAKHAAEAEARNSEPPRPGSARATLRVPKGAEELKTRVALLHHALDRIRSLRRNLPAAFYEVAVELQQLRDLHLYDAKGYASFESFADRELDLGKAVAMKLARVPDVFREEAAERYGMDAVLAALGALDDAGGGPGTSAQPAHPLKPPTAGR